MFFLSIGETREVDILKVKMLLKVYLLLLGIH